MEIKYFVLYVLYLLFGIFTIAYFCVDYAIPMWQTAILGGVWGWCVGKDICNRFSDRQ